MKLNAMPHILTKVTANTAVFWDVTSRGLMTVMVMGAAASSADAVHFNNTPRRHITKTGK